ncbi:MAG: hypothetical protein WCP89_00060 [archaeon]
MRLMRYINLFERVSGVSTKNCFVYNNVIVFAVPKAMVSRAVGKDGTNMKRLAEILRRRVKVVAVAHEDADLQKFISDVVDPITFNKIEIRDGLVIISAGRANKAALIGRDRTREKELSVVLKNLFKVRGLRVA